MGRGCRSICGIESEGACESNCRLNCTASSCTAMCSDAGLSGPSVIVVSDVKNVEHDPTHVLMHIWEQLETHSLPHTESHHHPQVFVHDEHPLSHLTEQIPMHIPIHE